MQRALSTRGGIDGPDLASATSVRIQALLGRWCWALHHQWKTSSGAMNKHRFVIGRVLNDGGGGYSLAGIAYSRLRYRQAK